MEVPLFRRIAAGILLVGMIGCTGGDGAVNEPVGTTSESSPFRVGHPPEGYSPVQAGRGTLTQAWGEDSFGSHESVTVLAPKGEGPGGPGEVRVELFGYEGLQGRISQGLIGYGIGDPPPKFELDGKEAVFKAAHETYFGQVPAQLAVDFGNDVGVLVSKASAGRDELAEIALATRPQDDHLLAPVVDDPPGGLEVVGSADADVGFSLTGFPSPNSDHLPAGERGHTAAWARPKPGGAWFAEDGTVVVTTLPGLALDLDAVVASTNWAVRRNHPPEAKPVEVSGRPGRVVTFANGNEDTVVVSSTKAGDLLLVNAHGPNRPSVDQLVAVASSVEPATAAEWDQFVTAVRGGPGLRADAGAVELERGKVGDIEWLMQAVEPSPNSRLRSRPGPQPAGMTVDDCLKLPEGRVCENQSASTGDTAFWLFNYKAPPTSTFPSYLIVTVTGSPAERARVHLQGAPAVDIALHPVPGGPLKAGIVTNMVFPQAPVAPCLEPGAPTYAGLVELLDRSGRRVACPK